jgi:hypothetical protein
VAVSDRNTAIRSAKKAFYIQNRPTLFLLHLGCLLLEYIVQSPQGYAHFYRRLPNGMCLKNSILQWQSSKKIERTIKGLSVNFGCLIWCFGSFWKVFLENKNEFFK